MLAAARWASGRDESFCLDVVQDAMLKIIRSIPILDTREDLSRWLRRVVTRCAYDALRSERRRAARHASVAAARGSSSSEPSDAEQRERLEWLASQIASLPDPAASLVVGRFRFGLTLERLGRSLGIAPGAADGRLTRTLRALRSAAPGGSDD